MTSPKDEAKVKVQAALANGTPVQVHTRPQPIKLSKTDQTEEGNPK